MFGGTDFVLTLGASFILSAYSEFWKLEHKTFRNKEIISYIVLMHIVEVSTGKKCPIEILPLENSDYKLLSKTRYFFDWKEESGQEIYKLVLTGDNDIQGLASVERIPSEWRIHIRLLTVSKENRGQGKKFDRITGNLMAHVDKIAVNDYRELACVSLRPKSSIAQHYIDEYNMNVTGMTLSLEVPEIINLINQFDHDE